MTNQNLAATNDPATDDIDTPAFWELVEAYGRELRDDGHAEGYAEARRALLEHLTTIRAADKHALWCADVNLDGAKEHLAEVQRDLAAALAKNTTLAPSGVRIPLPVIDTPLAREIEADAASYEAAVGERPERVAAPGYPWGWVYVTDKHRAGFLGWCRGGKSEFLANQEKLNG
jgi:hypothetical protein